MVKKKKNQSNFEPVVYTWRNILEKGKDWLVFQAQGHDESLSEVHPTTLGNLSSFSLYVQNFDGTVVSEPSPNPIPIASSPESNRHLPIASRKKPQNLH